MSKPVYRALRLTIVSAFLFASVGCKDENPAGYSLFKAATGEATGASLFFDGLRNSTKFGYHFEAWAVRQATYVSLGKFRLGADGEVVDLDGNKMVRFNAGTDIASSSRVEITLEPNGDPDPAPSSVVLLSGDVVGGMASLTVPILPRFLMETRGRYILATPTATSQAHETSGVWFIDPSVGPGLVLPFLPPGWKFEGWVMTRNGYVSTGKFSNAVGQDESDAYSGPLPGPPYPGEDFLMNAPRGFTFPLQLHGARLIVTLEPSPDDDPNLPFQLVLLSADIPADAVPRTVYSMTNVSQSFPTGQAILY